MTAAVRTRRLEPPTPWQRNATFGIIATTIVLGYLGDALSGLLLGRHPLTMILLNAKPRYLVLTVNELDPWTYYLVGTFRLLCTKPLVWLIGGWYGDRAVGWAERRSTRGAGAIRWVERHFGRYGWVVIAITSNNVVCLLAGSAGFSLIWFMVLAVAGTLVRLWIFAQVGDVFSTYIADVVGFIGDHRAPIVALSVAVVAGGLWWQHRSGTSSLDDLASLEDAVDDEPER
ncbi:VTT domain-containing protein [Aquihabitans sp. G128]|uniref:DedA family protein n=1 Tax=Aquihabitans sp. G128 TaxID=2849779 RepID=UPI001C21CE51|nr:VTT domain-containing protein [Aquihabitans sp. G128]QXC62437.1 VTT domain-containing protein [Aquihabitans sp. G128]